MQQKWPGWYNILIEGSKKETSANLSIVRWKFAPKTAENNDHDDTVQTVDHVTAKPCSDNPNSNPHNKAIRVVDNPLNLPFPEVQSQDDILPLIFTPLSNIHLQQARLSTV